MRSLSYRTKRRVGRLGKTLLVFAAILALLLVAAVVYLGRFVVYTPDGAHLDFGRNTALDSPAAPTGPSGAPPVESAKIEIADPNRGNETAELVSGYYIDLDMLSDPDAVLQAIRTLDSTCTVMLDLKGGDGSFYYTSGIEDVKQAAIDVEAVDRIISTLKNRGFTMVARVKTFQDSAFALAHIKCSLPIRGGALWVGGGCYWLDPANETVLAYLKQIARDLAGKGFKEIVFDDFYFPESTQIVYETDKSRTQLMADTARELLTFFSSSNITISFGNPRTAFSLGEGSHLYYANAIGSDVNKIVRGLPMLDDPAARIVFLTGSKDSRFGDYQLLRPLLTSPAR